MHVPVTFVFFLWCGDGRVWTSRACRACCMHREKTDQNRFLVRCLVRKGANIIQYVKEGTLIYTSKYIVLPGSRLFVFFVHS